MPTVSRSGARRRTSVQNTCTHTPAHALPASGTGTVTTHTPRRRERGKSEERRIWGVMGWKIWVAMGWGLEEREKKRIEVGGDHDGMRRASSS
eukprot:3285598-Rhodomonas_salina.2